MRALFVYGSLTFAETLHEVLGRLPDGAPAEVEDWRAVRLAGRTFPGLVRSPGWTTPGLLLRGLNPTEVSLIRRFEGPFYGLETLVTVDGDAAETYVLADLSLATDERWDPAQFRRDHLAVYIARCRRWRAALTETGVD